MKTMTVVLSEEEAERVEAAARDRGITPDDVLHDAVSNYLREFPPLNDERPDLWFIGLASSLDQKPRNAGPPETIEEEIAREIWEDSFGGTRPWVELDEGEQPVSTRDSDVDATP